MNLSNMSVAVIGAGIGGMAAACAFALRGASVTVYERAPALEEVGAGLQISVNGQRVLAALGLESAVRAAATVSPGTEFRDGWSGRRVAFVPPPLGGATWYVHRADLLAALASRAENLGVAVRLGQTCAPGEALGDLCVAADGAGSAWRGVIDGDFAPAFTGQVAWRALVPWNGDAAAAASVSMGAGAHVVAYPLRGGRLLNLVAIEERRDWREEGWSLRGDPEAFQKRFSVFGGELGAALARVRDVHTWALHARPVAGQWFRDRAVLLGDAAHPTLPFMAQGACLALEDAWILSRSLAEADCLQAGLRVYTDLRKPRVEKVVALARGNAWRFHMPRPFAWGAQAVLAVGAGALARRLEWVYGYDATSGDAVSALPKDAPPAVP